MKIFTNKNLIQKLIIAIVCVTILNFCMAPKVKADFGGQMMSYIREFVTALGDVVISVVQLGLTGEWVYAVDEAGSGISVTGDDYWKDKIEYPIIQISPELIFGNKIELLSIDFIGGVDSPEEREQYILKTDGSAVEELRTIIASWYVTLRTIAIVGLLSILIYVGIRIIISSTSQDKAKYKQRLIDWIVAFCLLFFMHYIMAATVNVIGKVNEMLGNNLISGISLSDSFGDVQYNGLDIYGEDQPDGLDAEIGVLENVENVVRKGPESNYEYYSLKDAQDSSKIGGNYAIEYEEVSKSGSSHTYKYTMGYVRLPDGSSPWLEITVNLSNKNQVIGGSARSDGSGIFNEGLINAKLQALKEQADRKQEEFQTDTAEKDMYEVAKGDQKFYVSSDSVTDGSKILYYINYARLYLNVSTKDEYIAISVGYLILYLVLIVFTVMFTIRYMKRVIYIAFLTLMAPLVAMTYPLDKIKDRKSTSL